MTCLAITTKCLWFACSTRLTVLSGGVPLSDADDESSHFRVRRRFSRSWAPYCIATATRQLQTSNSNPSQMLPPSESAWVYTTLSNPFRQMTGYFKSCLFHTAYFWPLCVIWVPSVLWHCWLGGKKGIRPVKNWLVGCWRGYLSGARCRLAYGPADATATHRLLLQ